MKQMVDVYEKVANGVVRRRQVERAELPVLTVDSKIHSHPRFVLSDSITILDPREVRRPPDPVIGTSARTIGFGTKLSKR
ncbi:MAG: hypothetical protein WC551_06315 [Patescibacteria group bacterium]